MMTSDLVPWRVLFICRLGRSHPDWSCEILFDESEWKSTYRVMYPKRKLPSEPPRLQEMPGPQTTWIGLQRMRDFARAWNTFGPGAEKSKKSVERQALKGAIDFANKILLHSLQCTNRLFVMLTLFYFFSIGSSIDCLVSKWSDSGFSSEMASKTCGFRSGGTASMGGVSGKSSPGTAIGHVTCIPRPCRPGKVKT